MIPITVKYVCNKCKNTFVTTEGDVITTNMICQECGGSLKFEKMDLIDRINPLERAKSIRHHTKSIIKYISKKT